LVFFTVNFFFAQSHRRVDAPDLGSRKKIFDKKKLVDIRKIFKKNIQKIFKKYSKNIRKIFEKYSL